MRQKMIKFGLLVILMMIVIFIGNWVHEIIYASRHEKIKLTPIEVVHALQNSGYEIGLIKEVDPNDVGGVFGEVDQFLEVEINSESVLIFSYPEKTWEKARQAVEIGNGINRRWNGGHGYSYHYGYVIIQVATESKEFGLELIRALEASD